MRNARLTKEPGPCPDDAAGRRRHLSRALEAEPARALVEIGVPAEVAVNLKEDCIERRTLASKETFRKLLRETTTDAIASAMQMRVPQVGLGKRSTAAESQIIESAFAERPVPSSERIATHWVAGGMLQDPDYLVAPANAGATSLQLPDSKEGLNTSQAENIAWGGAYCSVVT